MSTARKARRRLAPATVPANGQPVTFASSSSMRPERPRSADRPRAFIADQLERVAGTARFLRAETPAELYDRQEVEEDNLRTHWYDLGASTSARTRARRRTLGPIAPPIPIDARPITSGMDIPDDCPW